MAGFKKDKELEIIPLFDKKNRYEKIEKNPLNNLILKNILTADDNIREERDYTRRRAEDTAFAPTEAESKEALENEKLREEVGRVNEELRVAKNTITDLNREIGNLQFKIAAALEREAALKRMEQLLKARDGTISSLKIRIEDLVMRVEELQAKNKTSYDPKGSFKNLGVDPEMAMEIFSILGPEGIIKLSGGMKKLLGTLVHPDKLSDPDKKTKANGLFSKASGAADLELNDPAKITAWHKASIAKKKFGA